MEQDFFLMFGKDVSGKFLEKWTTTFKKKIIQQCRKLPSTSELEYLLLAADPPEDGTEEDVDIGKYDFFHIPLAALGVLHYNPCSYCAETDPDNHHISYYHCTVWYNVRLLTVLTTTTTAELFAEPGELSVSLKLWHHKMRLQKKLSKPERLQQFRAA